MEESLPLRFIDVLFLCAISRKPEPWYEAAWPIVNKHAPEVARAVRLRAKNAATPEEKSNVLCLAILQNYNYLERYFTAPVHQHPHHKLHRAVRDAEIDGAAATIPQLAMHMEQTYMRGAAHTTQQMRLELAHRLFEARAFNIFMGGITFVIAVQDNSLWLVDKIMAPRARQPPSRYLESILWTIIRLCVVLSRNEIFNFFIENPHIASILSYTRLCELAVIACNRTLFRDSIYRMDDHDEPVDLVARSQEDVRMAYTILQRLGDNIPPTVVDVAISSDNYDMLKMLRISFPHILLGTGQPQLVSFETRAGTHLSPNTVALLADWYPLDCGRMLWMAAQFQRGPIIEQLLSMGSGVAAILRKPAHLRHIVACSIRTGITSPQFSRILYSLMNLTSNHVMAMNNNEFIFSLLWNLISEGGLESDRMVLEHPFVIRFMEVLVGRQANEVFLTEPCYPRTFGRFHTYEDLSKHMNELYHVDSSVYYFNHDEEICGIEQLRHRELRVQNLMEQLILPERYKLIRTGVKCIVPFKDELMSACCGRP